MKYKNLLLVEDDEDDQTLFLMALKSVGKEVHCSTAENGKEALDKLRNLAVSPDLIFLDLNMPVMNGQEFLTEIKKDQSLDHIPVMVLSTSRHKSTIELTKELGAEEFFSKPENFD
jgi:CheY-like chemotaxis protein